MIFTGLLQAARPRSGGLSSTLRHLGALGLFFMAILDSTPLPTFGGADILTAILAATHISPWYVYAAVATAGSVIGAYITFRLARQAGVAFLDRRFGRRVPRLLDLFKKWGTGSLAASTAIPFPFPTSVFFAAAGASDYSPRKFLIVVALGRGVRYSIVAFLADQYGRHLIRVLRHPAQYWGWALLFVAVIAGMIGSAILIQKRLESVSEAGQAMGRAQ